MRSFAYLAALLILLSSRFSQAEGLKNFCLESSARKQICNTDLKGKIYLIDFWASWCPSCSQSINWLSQIEKTFPKEHYGFLAINLDAERQDADAFLKEHGAEIEFAFDQQGKVAEDCKLGSIPATILINKSGEIVAQWHGFSATVQAQILEALKKQSRDK